MLWLDRLESKYRYNIIVSACIYSVCQQYQNINVKVGAIHKIKGNIIIIVANITLLLLMKFTWNMFVVLLMITDNVQVEDNRNKIVMLLKETSDITFSRILVNIFLANINTIIILNVFLMAVLVGLISINLVIGQLYLIIWRWLWYLIMMKLWKQREIKTCLCDEYLKDKAQQYYY